MIKRIVPVLLFSLGVFGCGTAQLDLSKKNMNIVVDGRPDEWNKSSMQSFYDGKILADAVYDNDYVYIAGECTDRQLGRQFALRGITLWIDPLGQENKDLEVNIMYNGLRRFNITRGNFFSVLDESQQKRALREVEKISNGVLVIDKKEKKSYIFTREKNPGFEAEILISDNVLTFEIKLPRHINGLFNAYSDLQLNKSMLGIFPGQSQFRRPGGMPSRMMGGRPGADGFPGGRVRESSANEIDELWIKLNADDK